MRPTLSDLGVVLMLAAALSAALIVLLRPFLARYALAKPNARSSHKSPTPQGGGIAVISAAAIAVALGAINSSGLRVSIAELWPPLTGVALLSLVGAVDDISTMRVLPRLVAQVIAAGLVVAMLSDDVRAIPSIPTWIERLAEMLAIVWFVNLVNFMDGIDWMTVAEVVPVTAAMSVLGLFGALPSFATIVALALLGAILGFAPFNRPVARLFLGDVGSLPIGLLLGWLLTLVAASGHFAAAALLPLYYLADATITLLWRLARRERVWQAHRSHFYQRAIENGFTISEVVGRVFALNLVLAALAGLSVWREAILVDVILVAIGSGLVAMVLASFARDRR